MGVRTRALLGTSAVVGIPIVVIRSLHGMADRPWTTIDFADPSGWLARTSIEDAVTAIARIVALALAYWLVAGTLLYLASVVSGSRRLMRLTAPLTLPFVRRMADRLIAGSIVAGIASAPLVAWAPPPEAASFDRRSVSVVDGYVPDARPTPPTTAETAPAFSGRPTTPGDVTESTTAPEEAVSVETSTVEGETFVTVERGDNLWSIAEAHLVDHLTREVSDHELAPYWRAVIDANLASLRSGDPDLIYPGERIVLPDPTGVIPPGS